MADAITLEQVEEALAASMRTPSGRKSQVKISLSEEHKRACASAASVYIWTARQDARAKRGGTVKWKKPKPIDYATGLTAHAERLEGIFRELASWQKRQDFLAVAEPAILINYRGLLETTAGVALKIAYTFRRADVPNPEYHWTSLGEYDDDKPRPPGTKAKQCIYINERPPRAFDLWIQRTASVWRDCGNTVNAEKTLKPEKPERDAPFLRFLWALNERMPTDVRWMERKQFANAVHHSLDKDEKLS